MSPLRTPAISRREVLIGITGAGLGVALSTLAARGRAARPEQEQDRNRDRADTDGEGVQPAPSRPGESNALTPEDQSLLDEIQRATFLYFWEQADPLTGLVRDRFNVRAAADPRTAASIAATGFGLTAICIGEERQYVRAVEARDRVIATLRFLHSNMPTHRGFYYHWANVHSGARIWDSEISSIDTAILLCGVLTCREHFRHREITRLATQIFDRVEWTWLSADTSLLPHGWRPEVGFLQYRWDMYSELMMMYLLGLGSSTSPLPVQTWHAWKRTTFEYDGLRYIGSFAPLFVHQYSQAWFDFRNRRDRYADYFRNSVDRHRSPSSILPGAGRALSPFQRGSVGHHGVGLAETGMPSGAVLRRWGRSTGPLSRARRPGRCRFCRGPRCASSRRSESATRARGAATGSSTRSIR